MNLNPQPSKHSGPAKTNVVRKKNYQLPTKKSTLQDPPPPPPIDRKKRVFGTNRCPNIQPKSSVVDKPLKKPSTSRNPAKKSPEIRLSTSKQEKETDNKEPSTSRNPAKKSPEIRLSRSKQVKETDNKVKDTEKSDTLPRKNPVVHPNRKVRPLDGPTTPIGEGSTAAVAAATPFHTARNFRKNRFEDELETSSYWLAQILSAEAVGKHFVSAAFFRLAANCKAEPMGSLRGELRRYMKRHEHLHSQEDWRLTCQSYGLVQDLESPQTQA